MERVPHLDEMLSKYRKPDMACIARQPIEHRKYRPCSRILDGDDESVDAPILKRTERSCESNKA